MATTNGPFTHDNRPWQSDECLDNMNAEFASCMAMTPPDDRDVLYDWMMWKVEMGYCHEQPEVMARCMEYGDRYIAAKLKGHDLERLHLVTDHYSKPLTERHWDGREKIRPLHRTVAGPPVVPEDPQAERRVPQRPLGLRTPPGPH